MRNPREYNCRVTMGYPKTAQKSYGRERRLLMCYPAVVLQGEGWRRRVDDPNMPCKSSDCRIHRWRPPFTDAGVEDKRTFVTAEMKTTNGEVWRIPDAIFNGVPAMAQLRINDDREDISVRATFLKLRLFYNNCHEIGVFTSNMISVVSKPHRTATVTGASGMAFKSGDVITLSIRNTKMTRNLCLSNGNVSADLPYYSTFFIYLVDEDMEESEKIQVIEDQPITYGSVVKLVDTENNIGLPKMRILRADERGIDICGTPGVQEVLHFQRAAFQFFEEPNLFLGLDDRDYQTVRPKFVKREPFVVKPAGNRVADMYTYDMWLLIPHETISFTFAEMNGPTDSVTPAPYFDSHFKYGDEGYVTLVGRDFSARLQAWLDDIPMETFYKNSETIVCRLPSKEEREESVERLKEAGIAVQSLLYLVRDDGVLYPSPFIL
ncbi:hypothetical protein L596_018216 [Steinernema carpocapsae]|uniref:Uncharacterized protein n=1 Tax=Steinernema carpocapsae TaxID=34508 RepID=A0A4U5N4Q2_STECR|nr:hypothetical protein L596_018216 [Steinernema carpocapsae]